MARTMNHKTHEYKVNLLKLAAQTIIENAEDYVGHAELMTDLTVSINIPDCTYEYELPTISVSKDYYSRNVVDYESNNRKLKQ